MASNSQRVKQRVSAPSDQNVNSLWFNLLQDIDVDKSGAIDYEEFIQARFPQISEEFFWDVSNL